MGCDIDLYLDLKIDGEWKGAEYYIVERVYTLFALMANVRNNRDEIIPISESKGWTNYISDKFKNIQEEETVGDFHSHSFLNRFEIKQLITRYNQIYGYNPDEDCPNDLIRGLAPELFDEIYKYLDDENIEDVCLI